MTPTNIHVHHPSQRVEIDWDDGSHTSTEFARLRQYCACAWCRAEGRIGDPPPTNGCKIEAIKPVGVVGINIIFADGHDRGLFPWSYLRAIADDQV